MSTSARTPATATLLAKIKRQAKGGKASGRTHTQLLEAGALEAGYASFHELQQACLQAAPATIPLDPQLPPQFDQTPNEARSVEELDTWWDRPFAVTRRDGTLDVVCLDGGAWDRSTWYGVADDLQSATRLAAEKLAWWRKIRSAPIVSLSAGKVNVVRPEQRPDEEPELLYEASSMEDAAAWIQQVNEQASAEGTAGQRG